MIISRDDQVFQLICKYCHQYANKARVCKRCQTIYCYDCLKQQPIKQEYFHNNHEQICCCKINFCKELNCVEQYVADKLKIQCSLCNQIKQINKIKKHQAKCHMKEQEAFKYFQFYNNFSILQKISLQQLVCTHCMQIQFQQIYLIKKYDQQIMCKNCVYTQLQTQKYQVQMSEEQLCCLAKQQFQCLYCMKKGSYFQILNHNYICNKLIIDCQCGSSIRRSAFLDHFKICANNQLEKHYLKLQQINLLEKKIQFQYSKGLEVLGIIFKKISYVCEIVYQCGLSETTIDNDDNE